MVEWEWVSEIKKSAALAVLVKFHPQIAAPSHAAILLRGSARFTWAAQGGFITNYSKLRQKSNKENSDPQFESFTYINDACARPMPK